MAKIKKSSKDPENDLDAVFRADDYLYFYEESLSDAAAEQEISFLIHELGLEKRMKILDLACGHGRHANRLARLGYQVTAVDRSREFLDLAETDAKQRNATVTYHCADIREYSVVKKFDRVIHLFSSFGYFTDAENEQVIKNIAASLKIGGLLCLDILNRDAFLQYLPSSAVREKNGDFLIDRNRFDPLTGRLHNDRMVIRRGHRRDIPFFLRLYNPTEIISLLEKAGLTVEKIYGDWAGAPFVGTSKRMILIARTER